ncbi:AcrR family transcriptional regulator [Lipingzhangella halophila]|uniref:AcrR family transcriptional regulator n=1 Tax=Lipingzhangella halophila TaxID=1783352 RepID=A0A7W7W5P3_9ACTN|nr:TetR/AcrR family transcriptional regulator [Lipingzhangella halophila]MBB4934005.1 AcrR family transcriptional regulator [Lipingzhangella halophila]
MAAVSALPTVVTTRIGGIIDTPRKKPRQVRSRETVDAVLEAAAQLFEREGLDTTTNRIAERSGFSIGTLYQYFPNKWALLYGLAEHHIEKAHERLGGVLIQLREQEPDWDDTVRELAAASVDLHRHRPRLHALMYHYAPRAPEGIARLDTLHETLVSEVTGHLVRCDRGGDDPARTAAMLVHAADAQLHRVLLGRGDDAEALTWSLLAMTPR